MANTYQSYLLEEALYTMQRGQTLKTLIKGAQPYIIDAYQMRGMAYTHFGAIDNILGRKHIMFIFDLETNE